MAYLRQEIVGQAERLQRRSVAHDLLSTAEHLRLALQLRARRAAGPERTPQLLAELEAAKERADELRQRSARWQVTLNDGITDLIADMDYDLRDRMRAVQREAEQAIDAGDPGPVWDQFADWLEQRVASAVSDTFVWTNERSQWLAEQVAEPFRARTTCLPLLQRRRHRRRARPRRTRARPRLRPRLGRCRRCSSACADRTAAC